MPMSMLMRLPRLSTSAACTKIACVVDIQIRDVPEPTRKALAEMARARGQSMQAYVRALLDEHARRAGNVALLRQVRAVDGGCVTRPGETASELDALRAERDARNSA